MPAPQRADAPFLAIPLRRSGDSLRARALPPLWGELLFFGLGFVLHRIDRDILQIVYMDQRTDDYNDWGEWSDMTLHLVAESVDGNVRFGVALFNGLPQPWPQGTLPDRGTGADILPLAAWKLLS